MGSAEDPVKQNGKSSYHPFEEITVSASDHSEDARLTAAETSRTIIEVFSCFFFSLLGMHDDDDGINCN